MGTRSQLLRWGVALLTGTVILGFTAHYFVDGLVRTRLQTALQRAAGQYHTVHLGEVRTNLLNGSLEVLNASMNFDSVAMDSLLAGAPNGLLRIHADRIAFSGLSYAQLLRNGGVSVKAIDILGPTIDHYLPLPGRPLDETTPTTDSAQGLPPLVTVDTLRILGAHGGTHDPSGERTSARVGEMDILSGGIVVVPRGKGRVVFRTRSTVLMARALSAAFPPLYDLHIGTLELLHPAGILRATAVAFDPRADAQGYGDVVKYETDLFRARADTLLVTGMDIHRFVVLQELFVQHADVRSPVLSIYRDKTMPDGPFRGRRLPPAGLRHMDRRMRVDSVTIRNGLVEYYERDSLSADYGKVSFAGLDAVLTGMGNTPDLLASGELRLDATARIYDRSTIEAHYRAPLREGSDQFTLHARLRALPFSAFNRMTDSLLMVKVKAGRIDELEMRMRGNDDHATGTLDVVYDGLDVMLQSRDPRQPRTWLMNRALQLLVRKSNLRGAKNYRQGTFTVVRRRDRSIFNYAWRGVRAGTLDSMVPGLLSKYAQQKANKKARER